MKIELINFAEANEPFIPKKTTFSKIQMILNAVLNLVGGLAASIKESVVDSLSHLKDELDNITDRIQMFYDDVRYGF